MHLSLATALGCLSGVIAVQGHHGHRSHARQKGAHNNDPNKIALLERSLSTASAVPTSAVIPKDGEKWDAIVVGGGPTGIIAATKLAEAGKSVLLLENGGPTTWETGGRWQNEVWKNTNVNIYDSLGFTRSLWAEENLNRSFFADIEEGNQAASILGGGSAVNAGQQLYPHKYYYDTFLPDGWKFADIEPAIKEVKRRVFSAASTSSDGKLYNNPELYTLTSGLLMKMGFNETSNVNEDLESEKGFTFGRQQFVSPGGHRGGPLVGYLPAAMRLQNFKLIMNSKVTALVRKGRSASGVIVMQQDGSTKTYLAKNVVLAAGVFGTPKILFRSGVGPADVLEGLQIPKQQQLVNDAIGRNVHDNPAFEIKLNTPGIVNVDARAAYEHPDPSAKAQYLATRSGLLTNPNRIMTFWLNQPRTDGRGRMTIHGTCGPNGEPNPVPGAWACKFRFVMSKNGTISWPQGLPWSLEKVDVDTHAAAIAAFQAGVQKYNLNPTAGHINVTKPLCYSTAECATWIESLKATKKWKGNMHWGGSMKMGGDEGTNGGTSAVDSETLLVYGLTNVFVIDGGLSPAPTTSNPVALYEVLAEHGSAKIIANMHA